MSDIPRGWPPHEGTALPRRAPLFPLPDFHLYPGRVEGMHVFERRYRQMVEDLLDDRGWVVIGPIREGHEVDAAGSPPVYSIATLGEIARHRKLPDGRYLLLIAGLARVRVREVESDRLYRIAEFEPIQEVPATEAEVEELGEPLRRAILARSEQFLDLPADLPLGALADLLLSLLRLPVSRRQTIFEEPSAAERARLALAEHERAEGPGA